MVTICDYEFTITLFVALFFVALFANNSLFTFDKPIYTYLINIFEIEILTFCGGVSLQASQLIFFFTNRYNFILQFLIPFLEFFLFSGSLLKCRVLFDISKVIKFLLQKFIKELSSVLSVGLGS